MIKSNSQLEQRQKFVKEAIDNPKLAANELKSMAIGLENCKNSQDVIYALTQILYISDQTIMNDYKK